jgi:hypothetical protein
MGDELARERRELPWVRVEKEYRFDTDEGPRTLAELFDGRSQLLVYHFMFGPSYETACPACSSMADTIDGVLAHLNARDVTMLLVSRAPLERLRAYKRRMGWSIPWASTAGNDFNFDFGASATPEQVREQLGPALDDPASGLPQMAASTGTDAAGYLAESPAGPTATAFVLDDGVVSPASLLWLRRHDEWVRVSRPRRGAVGQQNREAPKPIRRPTGSSSLIARRFYRARVKEG